ncbi:hypothetical protein [Chryseobacterium sp. HSC-36S06]|uniref:hypothetical protein n=1 Tax=Chryseobacterium sp. HSC-36S06 TaxID=2910970 RepID=UPI00209CA4BC|nr:hypothetical protein [Chryseobacterium sp. HSC-36S06]MCP2038508.1 hypothetical protein [Chryseobacterium sp. HSC-36S06]
MRNKFILGISLILFTISHAQVGINTTTPNGATVLDINSNEKGILVPRLTDSERDTKLADNDPLTVPPAGVVNLNLAAGTLIYNTTADRFEFWDGLVWRQLFVATSSVAGNDGVVKVDSGAGGVKPTLSLAGAGNTYGPPVQVLYTTPLVFAPSPTTSWPETTVPYPGVTANIYSGATAATQRWRENLIMGQVHVWRVVATATAGSNSTGSLLATFKNPDSGFEINSIALLPSGSSGVPKVVTFYFYTIADPLSIPEATKGYQLWMTADQTVSVRIESMTRVSLFKD